MKQAVGLLVLLCLLVPAQGCDKATPVAPTGSVLTISANPTKIGLTGSSTITVVGRKPDGNPLNPGTEIRLSADRGSIDPLVTVDSSGRATATFRGDGRTGDATIKASVADASVEIKVQIGESDTTKPSLLVSVNPSSVRVGQSSTVTVIARNPDGTPIGAGEQIILTTDLGTLDDSRPLTAADGTATTILRAGNQAGTATVRAVLRAGEGTASLTIRDFAASLILTPTQGTIDAEGETVTFTANVANTQGEPFAGAAVTFSTNVNATFGGGSNVALTDSSGTARKEITFAREDLNGETEVRVTASTPNATGGTISKTAIFDIE